MEFTRFTADFSKRTLRNLDCVQQQVRRGEPGAYEVTQLWNSLLGLVVLPHERMIEGLATTSVQELSPGRSPLSTTLGAAPETVGDLIKRLRNAVAHFNVEFNIGTDGEIASATVWNEARGRRATTPGRRTWEGVITVGSLEALARLIANAYIGEFESTAAH